MQKHGPKLPDVYQTQKHLVKVNNKNTKSKVNNSSLPEYQKSKQGRKNCSQQSHNQICGVCIVNFEQISHLLPC